MKKYSLFFGTVTMIRNYIVGSDEELKGCFKLAVLCIVKKLNEKPLIPERLFLDIFCFMGISYVIIN